MNRREYLTISVATVGGVMSLAGCLSPGGEEGEGGGEGGGEEGEGGGGGGGEEGEGGGGGGGEEGEGGGPYKRSRPG